MLRRVMKVVIAGAIVLMSAAPARAQVSILGLPIEEIRFDLFQVSSGGDPLNLSLLFGSDASISQRVVGLGMPGKVSLGIYVNDKFAVEPFFGWTNVKVTTEEYDYGEAYESSVNISVLNFGAALPYYLAGDRGRSGLFVAPMFEFTKLSSGDIDCRDYDSDCPSDLQVGLGFDFGFKQSIAKNVSMRAAANFRAPDRGDAYFGGTVGFSMFFR